MTDPKRWLEDERVASSLEARVLAVGTELEPPAELVEQSFAKFAALVGGSGGAGGPSWPAGDAAQAASVGQGAALSTGAAAGTLGASVLKAVGLGALLGTLTMTSAHLGSRPASAPQGASSDPAASAGRRSSLKAISSGGRLAGSTQTANTSERAPVAADAARAAPVGDGSGDARSASRSQERARVVAGGELTPPSTPRAAPEKRDATATAGAAFPDEPASAPMQSVTAGSGSLPSRSSALKAEALQLAEAKNLLQQGRASEALPLLVTGSQRFANGALLAERELLIVQTLTSLGRREEARRRGLTFLASHGEGPISLRMRRLIEAK